MCLVSLSVCSFNLYVTLIFETRVRVIFGTVLQDPYYALHPKLYCKYNTIRRFVLRSQISEFLVIEFLLEELIPVKDDSL